MDLRHLRYFVSAVEEGSLQAAAEKLAIAQPALSRRIQDLEADLSCELLARSVRGVVPTRAGLVLYREAQQILEKVGRAAQLTRRVGLEQAQDIRLGVVQSARKYAFVQEALAAHAAAHPAAGLSITRGPSRMLADGLREARLDVTLLYEQHVGGSLLGELLVHRERYVLAAHPAHRLAVPGPIALRQLAGESFIWLRRQDTAGQHNPLLQFCRLNGVEPVIAQLADSPEDMVDLVAVTGGLCLTPASTALTTPAGQLFFRAVPELTLNLDLTLAWNRNLETGASQAFMEQMHLAIARHQAAIDLASAAWAHCDGLRVVWTS